MGGAHAGFSRVKILDAPPLTRGEHRGEPGLTKRHRVTAPTPTPVGVAVGVAAKKA